MRLGKLERPIKNLKPVKVLLNQEFTGFLFFKISHIRAPRDIKSIKTLTMIATGTPKIFKTLSVLKLSINIRPEEYKNK